MYYAPHTLQAKRLIPLENDELGRPIPGTGCETWVDVCRCRCDDNTTKEFRSENGNVFRPQYHVVCEGSHGLSAGDEVRCIEADGSVRGQGSIFIAKRLNYLSYSEIWM